MVMVSSSNIDNRDPWDRNSEFQELNFYDQGAFEKKMRSFWGRAKKKFQFLILGARFHSRLKVKPQYIYTFPASTKGALSLPPVGLYYPACIIDEDYCFQPSIHKKVTQI